MATHPVRFTADDLWNVPVPAHLLGYELVDGRLIEVTPASPRHGAIALEIGSLLRDHLKRTGTRGRAYVDAGYVLGLRHDPDRVRAPDVSYVAADTLDRGGQPDHGFFRLVPDLAVEIDSPGRKPRIEQQRIRDYLEAGVRLLWVIHTTSRSATVHRIGGQVQLLAGADALDGEDVLPGFRVALSEVFNAAG